jgi:hypothetical protein
MIIIIIFVNEISIIIQIIEEENFNLNLSFGYEISLTSDS